MTRRYSRRRGWAMLALCLSVGACEPPAVEVDPPAERTLREVPEPVRQEALDPSVREQYRQRRGALDRLLEDPKATDGELAEACGQLGLWFQAYQMLEHAEIAYGNARLLSPDDLRWIYYSAHLSRIRGDLEAARRHFQRALELRPGDVPSLVWLGEAELEAGNLGEAERRFSTALDRDPRCARALAGRGRVALAEQRYEAAVELLEGVRRLQPAATESLYPLALAYRGAGDPRQAARVLAASENAGRAVALELDDPLLQRLHRLRVDGQGVVARALELAAEGRYEESLRELRRVESVGSGGLEVKLNIGVALLELGRIEEAREAFLGVLETSPDHARARLYLALCAERLGHLEEAERGYRAALESDPGSKTALARLSDLLVLSARSEEALGYYRRWIQLDPADVEARYSHAVALSRLGRWQEALGALEEHLGMHPGDRNLLFLQARILAAAPDAGARDGRRALRLATEAFRQRPVLSRAETVAMAHAELGAFEQAVAWQRAALEAAERSGEDLPWVAERLETFARKAPLRAPWAPAERPTEIPVAPPG